MTWFAAVKAAVNAADYEELALSYPQDKIKNRLDHYQVKIDETKEEARYIACALDTGLITSKTAERAVAGDTFTAADEVTLLMLIANANGDARNYLGMSDSQISMRSWIRHGTPSSYLMTASWQRSEKRLYRTR